MRQSRTATVARVRHRPQTSQSRAFCRFLTGKELDPDSIALNVNNARYHFPARFYVPFRGVFGQGDPLLVHLPQNLFGLLRVNFFWQRFAYAKSRPTVVVDPAGLWGAVTFENCPDPICADGSTQKQITDMIGKSCDQIEGALRWIKSFIIPMSSYDMIPDEQLQAGLKKSKLVPRGKEVIAKSDLFGARDILERAKKKCDEGFTVECIACCDEDEAPAYVRTPFWGLWYGDIVLCLNKFCNLNARDQQSKLLHEITHYGGSSDTPSEGVIGADDLERDVPALAESPGK